jgi:hypothetical protein
MLMTDPSQPAAPASVTPNGKWWETPVWQRVTKIVTVVAGLIVGVLGLVKLYNAFVPSIPSCSASSVAGVIRDIYKQKNIELTDLSDMKEVSATSAERNCQAHIETAQETGTLGYKITLQGNQFHVLITKADATPKAPKLGG